MGNIRTREHDTISRIGSQRPLDAESTQGYSVNAYDRINEQISQMKEKIIQSKLAHDDFSRDQLRVEETDKKAMTFRDFYKANPFDSDDDNSNDSYYSGSGSGRSADDTANPVEDGASHLKKGKRELYESQLKKAQAGRQTNLNSTTRVDFSQSEYSTSGL